MATESGLKITYTRQYLEEPDSLEEILAHVSAGGSVIDLCRARGFNYNTVTRWLRLTKERSELYDKALSDRSEVVIESVLVELRRISSANITSIYSDMGTLLPMSQWPDEITSTIKEITHDKDTGAITKISFWSKEKAIELLGKNLGLFVDRIEHSHKVKLEDIIGGSFEDPEETAKDVTPMIEGVKDE